MCTLSIFRKTDGYKVFMNRDERHDRVPEYPPQIIDETHGIAAPLDPQSGGTWIAYNKSGYWGCLLNGYFENKNDPAKNRKSRGTILPALLSQKDPLAATEHFNAEEYASFRLVIGSHDAHYLYVWDGQSYQETPFHAQRGDNVYLLTSSSWKQEEVIAIRCAQFEEWQKTHAGIPDTVPSFQISTQPEPISSMLMYRDYSATKSITGLDVTRAKTTMSYWKAAEGNPTAAKNTIILKDYKL